MKGEVYDLKGNLLGKEDDIVTLFLNEIRQAQAEGPCYVVTGGVEPEWFRDRLDEMGVPLIQDAFVTRGRSMLMMGTPDEWRDALGHTAKCDDRAGVTFCDPACPHYDGWSDSVDRA